MLIHKLICICCYSPRYPLLKFFNFYLSLLLPWQIHANTQQAKPNYSYLVDGKPLAELRIIRFTAGMYKTPWTKKVLALGLTAGLR